jgi:pilus assembly protein FimV
MVNFSTGFSASCQERWLLLFWLFFFHSVASAIELDEVKAHSYLGEPLRVDIFLHAQDNTEAEKSEIQLANKAEYEQQKLDWTPALETLKLSAEDTKKDRLAVRVNSSEKIDFPYLTFLMKWQNGEKKIFQPVTVLLDPPPASPMHSSSNVTEGHPPTPNSVSWYGPIRAGESLWSVVKRLYAIDSKPALDQMMQRILVANPTAFGAGDINKLLEGKKLTLPGSPPKSPLFEKKDGGEALNLPPAEREETLRHVQESLTNAAPEKRMAALEMPPPNIAEKPQLKLVTDTPFLSDTKQSNPEVSENVITSIAHLSEQVISSETALEVLRLENQALRNELNNLNDRFTALQSAVQATSAALMAIQSNPTKNQPNGHPPQENASLLADVWQIILFFILVGIIVLLVMRVLALTRGSPL